MKSTFSLLVLQVSTVIFSCILYSRLHSPLHGGVFSWQGLNPVKLAYNYTSARITGSVFSQLDNDGDRVN